MSYGIEGEYGLRSGIRTYKDVVQDGSWAKVVLAELYPGEPVTSWALSAGAVYVGAARRSHDGVRLDIMGVSTLLGTLTRSTIADPTAIAAGEYWYDVDAVVADIAWDDGVTVWDGVDHWDEFVALYVRMPDGSDPEDTEVEVEYLLAFASRAETHPVLGANVVSNGTFETYSTPGVPGGTFTGWTYATNATAGGTVTLDEDPAPYLGDAAARITLADVPYRGGYIYQDPMAVVVGQSYRVSGAYKVTGSGLALVSVRDSASAWFMGPNGRDAVAAAYQALPNPPSEEWHRFTWDFVAPTTGTLRLFLFAYAYNDADAAASPAMGTGTVSWDDVQVRQIHRMAHYSPRISGASVPTVQTGSNDVFFGGKQIGVGSIALLNHDAFFETLEGLDWINRKVVLKVGGAYLGDFYQPGDNTLLEADWTQHGTWDVDIAADGSLSKAAGTNWNAAVTSQKFNGNGYVEFTVTAAGGGNLGFYGITTARSASAFAEQEFGFYLLGGGATGIRVWEDGGQVLGTIGYNHSAGTVIRVEVRDGAVLYYVDGALVYTSLKTAPAAWMADACVYSQLDPVMGPVVVHGVAADDAADTRLESLAVEDYRTAFTGLIQNVKTDDVEFALDIQDVRAAYFRKVPTRAYTVADFPNSAPADEGKPRALWFGRKTHVRPIRYGSGAVYGLYELADCTDAPNGITEVAQVWNYVDQAAADTWDSTRRIPLNFKRTPALDITGADSSGMGDNDAEQATYKTGAIGWDAGLWLDQDTVVNTETVRFELTVAFAGDYRWMAGFSSVAPSTYSYTEIDFAIYNQGVGSVYAIYESGGLYFTSTLLVNVGDRVRILMDNGTVTYWVNGLGTDGWELVYTSLFDASGTYSPALACYDQNTYVPGLALYRSTDLYYTPTLSTARLTVDANVKALEVTHETKRVSFNDAGTEKTAIVQPGVYTPDEIMFQLTAAIAGVAFKSGVANLYTYSTATHKFTLASPNNLGFNFSSGEFTDLWKTLGFTQEDSTITDTSDAAESPVYTSDDVDLFLRVDGQGYKDDGSGTYTTVVDGLIEAGPDILRTLLIAFLKNPATIVDAASFESARARAPESVAIHMGREWSLKDIMETLEWTNIANISIAGDGTVYYDVYVGDVPTGIIDLVDSDFSAFAITWEAADVYRTVRTYYDEDPEGNFYLYRATENPDVEARFGRPEVKEFRTWLTFATAASNNSSRMSELAKAPAKQLRGTVRGKLLDHRVGQKVRVTRNRAASAGGLLSSSVYRLISIRQNHALGLSQFIAVPDVVTVAGVACLTACQSYCEVNCQSTCEGACQIGCMVSCEVGCQVACQSCDQTGCQDTCELTCQTGCEATCQVACQAACQTACQTACQSGCQVSCQTGCEVSCQDTCQLACQTGCEVSCQTSCEVTCQTDCQVACQFKCEWWCQLGESEQP